MSITTNATANLNLAGFNLTGVNILTATIGNIANLNSTSITINSISSTIGSIVNINSTSITTTNLTANAVTATIGSIVNINSTSITTSNLRATIGSIVNINSTSITTTNLTANAVTATIGSIVNINSTSITTSNLRATIGSIVNINSTSITTTNLTATIVNAGLGAVGAPSYAFIGDPNTGMWSPGADQIAWSTNGGERVRILANGNVGIGTTNPAFKLDVVGDVNITSTLTAPGVWVLLGSQILGADSLTLTVDNIPSGYKHLKCIAYGRTNTGGNSISIVLRFNSDAGTYTRYAFGTDGAVGFTAFYNQDFIWLCEFPGVYNNNYQAFLDMTIPNYTSTAVYKNVFATAAMIYLTGTDGRQETHIGTWENTSPITRIDIFPFDGVTQFLQYSGLEVYGLK